MAVIPCLEIKNVFRDSENEKPEISVRINAEGFAASARTIGLNRGRLLPLSYGLTRASKVDKITEEKWHGVRKGENHAKKKNASRLSLYYF